MLQLQDLWNLSDRFAAEHGVGPDDLFGECGLRLERPPHRWEYFCTPRNTITFGDLGVDGTHFGFLLIEDLPQERQPIVMTAPMSDKLNYVIAESLEEFIGLGFHVGWQALDQIALGADESQVESYFAQRHPESWPNLEEKLAYIRTGLGIGHVPLSFARLAYLNEKLGKFIDDGDEAEETNETKAARAAVFAYSELTEVVRLFRDAANEKTTFSGRRRDSRFYETMAMAYHRLSAAGDVGRSMLQRLLADPSPSVRSWIATALLVEGDASARHVLEELQDVTSKTTLHLYDEGKLGHPFPKQGT